MLSIICPSYNRANFLEACVVFAMELPDSEFVYIDDASTDKSMQIMTRLVKQYGENRIILLCNKANRGSQFCRNLGLTYARGDLVLFCDSDDIIIPSGVAHLVRVLKQSLDLDYAYGKVILTDAGLIPLPIENSIGSPFGKSPFDIAGYNWHTMGAVYRRSYIQEKVGPWDLRLTGSQDWEFQARVKLGEGKWHFCDVPVGYWRQHQESRVGTTRYRLDYTQSLLVACEQILGSARKSGIYDQALESRILKKALLHALECGANDKKKIRKAVFFKYVQLAEGNNLYRWAALLLKEVPYWANSALLKFILILQKCRKTFSNKSGNDARHSYPYLLQGEIKNYHPNLTCGIMITTKNRANDLERTLKHLALLDPPPDEILITLDGCQDDSAEVVRRLCSKSRIIINKVSQGSVFSRDRMLRKATADIMLSLDDDSFPEHKDIIYSIKKLFFVYPRMAVASFAQRTEEYPESLDQMDFGEVCPTRFYASAAAALRVAAYRTLPGYETLFFHMYEEPDYTLQCIANHWDVLWCPQVLIRHYWSKSGRYEIRNHQRHARNELWSTILRCPFPHILCIVLWRIVIQARYAYRHGFSWLIKEPIWWWDALKGLYQALHRRKPVSWNVYRKWLSLS